MVGMGYKLEDIQESLGKMKYDQFTATYLLLGRKASEVGHLASPRCLRWNQDSSEMHHTMFRPDPKASQCLLCAVIIFTAAVYVSFLCLS